MTTMSDPVFEVEHVGETIVVMPTVDLRELDYQRIEEGAKSIFDLLSGSGVRNVVIDLARTDYYGSTALGFFLRLWKRVKTHGGHMALCNVSIHEREILEVTRLDHMWPICASRNEALRAVST